MSFQKLSYRRQTHCPGRKFRLKGLARRISAMEASFDRLFHLRDIPFWFHQLYRLWYSCIVPKWQEIIGSPFQCCLTNFHINYSAACQEYL